MSRTGERDSSSSMRTRLVRGRGSKKTGAKPSSVCMISAELDSTVSSSSPILCSHRPLEETVGPSVIKPRSDVCSTASQDAYISS